MIKTYKFLFSLSHSSSSILPFHPVKSRKRNWVMANSKLQALWNHPAGPKTIHFWAPTFKWGLTIANILDSAKPPEQLSYAQQSVLAGSGLIWARYSTQIRPKNWNLVGVNFAMSITAMYQLSRKIQYESSLKNQEAAAEES